MTDYELYCRHCGTGYNGVRRRCDCPSDKEIDRLTIQRDKALAIISKIDKRLAMVDE